MLSEQEPYQPWRPSTAQAEHSKGDRAWLENYFHTKTQLHRDTVISSFNIDKEAAYKRLEEWIKAGYINKEGHGRKTYYIKGINLALAAPKSAGKWNPRDPVQVKQGLAQLFLNKSSINRENLLNVFTMQRSEANEHTSGWIAQSLLIPYGQGRSTYYPKPEAASPTTPKAESGSLMERILIALAEFLRVLADALRRNHRLYRIKG